MENQAVGRSFAERPASQKLTAQTCRNVGIRRSLGLTIRAKASASSVKAAAVVDIPVLENPCDNGGNLEPTGEWRRNLDLKVSCETLAFHNFDIVSFFLLLFCFYAFGLKIRSPNAAVYHHPELL